MVIFGAKTHSELTYNEWVERGHTKKEIKKERKKERNITFLYIFFALHCRGWLFLGLNHKANLPTMSG